MTNLNLRLAICAAFFATPAAAGPLGDIAYLGAFELPSGLLIDGVAFGGISAIDYDATDGVFVLLSDDRAERGPARAYVVRMDLDAEGVASFDIARMIALRAPGNATFETKTVDPEGLRIAPGDGTLLWSSEGDAEGRPTVWESTADGGFRRAFSVPDAYIPNADGTHGIYNNLAFEALCLSADGRFVIVGTENALVQDGAKATLEAGSPSRVILFDRETAIPVAEYVYVTEPIAEAATLDPFWNDNGLVDLLALDDETWISVERSYAHGVGNRIRLFAVTTSGASDVSGLDSIADHDVVPLTKTPLLTLAEGDFGLDLDNIEGIAFGPEVDGKRTLILAADNNFSRSQKTQFIAFTIGE